MKPLTKQERGKFLSMPAGRVDLLAAMTINKVRATLPFPLGRVKAGCGLIPLAPPGQLNLSVAVLQHLHSLGGFELIKKGARHNDRGYHLKCECEGKHYVETRADRKNDKVDGARQSATKKLWCLVSFDLLSCGQQTSRRMTHCSTSSRVVPGRPPHARSRRRLLKPGVHQVGTNQHPRGLGHFHH